MQVANDQLHRVANSLSNHAAQSLQRIRAEQERLQKQKDEQEHRERRRLEWRIRKAKAGLDRLRAFGKDPALQQAIRARDALDEAEGGLTFYEARWTWISDKARTFLTFTFQYDGVLVAGIDYCWMTRHKVWHIPYGIDEVMNQQYFSHPEHPADTTSLPDFLKSICDCPRINLADLLNRERDINVEEEDVLAELLIRWSSDRVFAGLVTRFLSGLEDKLQRMR